MVIILINIFSSSRYRQQGPRLESNPEHLKRKTWVPTRHSEVQWYEGNTFPEDGSTTNYWTSIHTLQTMKDIVTCSSIATNKCGFRIWWLDFYLAAHITTCLNYTHSYSAIAIPHIQQSLFTQQSTRSLFPAVFISDRSLLEHSNTLSALTACTLQLHSAIRYASLADYRRLLKHFSAVLPELHYWLPHWLGVLRTLTNTD
jgi:hypothetical protein